MKNYFSSAALLLAMQLLGCTVDVQPTDNGFTIDVQCTASSPDEQPDDEIPGTDEPSAEDPGTSEPGTDPGPTDPASTDPGSGS